jgi:hypothetical protein
MAVNSYPAWWRAMSEPPPATWTYAFEEFTGDDTADEWGIAAAVFIRQVRWTTSRGPSFSELFAELLPDKNGWPGSLPNGMRSADRQRAISAFRFHTAIEWRRRGRVDWDEGIARSLRVGKKIHALSREHRKLRVTVADQND